MQHVGGKKHRAAVASGAAAAPPGGHRGAAPVEAREERSTRGRSCRACGVSGLSAVEFDQHVQGKRHRANTRGSGEGRAAPAKRANKGE